MRGLSCENIPYTDSSRQKNIETKKKDIFDQIEINSHV